jgi:uncharacterized protein
MRKVLGLLLIVVALAACGGESANPLTTRKVRLPNGVTITAEVMIRPEDQARGMKYRDSLAADRGMLFLHGEDGAHAYWMHQVRIPLDIVWMDEGRRIVEMSPDTPPCPKPADQCPSYGGRVSSRSVLELAAGSIEKHGLKLGDRIEF